MKDKEITKSYKYTLLAVTLLEKLLGSKITFEGIENIPKKSVLFVANHFTRLETVLVPYVIYKQTKRQVRCLADNELFSGTFGRFLKSVGAISTKDKNRDKSIISDLVFGDYDWMIYPEGRMVKDKNNIDNKKSNSYLFNVFSNKDKKENRIRTGSAVLALKSELYRSDLIRAKKENLEDLLKDYKQKLSLEFSHNLSNIETSIVPLNITYYPIRPGKNIIQKIASKIFKKLPKQIAEELEIEGNILLSADMNISFGKAISLAEYIKITKNRIYQIPIIKNETKTNLVIRYFKNRLTNKFMDAVYSSTQINIDHIVAAILYFYPHDRINIRHLKSIIYVSISQIILLNKFRVNTTISNDNLYKLFIDEDFEPFTSIILLTKTLNIITKSDDEKTYFVNQNQLKQYYNFQQIRLNNTLRVIFNEFLLLETAVNVVKRNVLAKEEEIKQKSFDYIINKDLEIFETDYIKYYDENLSKDKIIGMPVFYNNNNATIKRDDGILLIHGYLSAPKEMEEMAKYFNNLGFKTYSVRLKGHGTSPINFENVEWQDWYDSLNFGYEALKLLCNRVFIIGFSTGGLLSLVAAAIKTQLVDGIVCINPALKLKDIRTKFAFGVNIWNDFLTRCKIDKGQLRYVENHSESPDINYSINYIDGVEQLGLLMNFCEDNLEKVTCPILIIQSSEDPVVETLSSRKALEKVSSKIKKFKEIDSKNHVIIKNCGDSGDCCNEVFKEINEWLFFILDNKNVPDPLHKS
jgi:esterase/lipase/1-acyl-sn-glycerol-3-phosphate acyltransferase